MPYKLVQVQLRFALITLHGAAENPVAAFRTYVAGLFGLNPFFSAKLPPIRNSAQDNFLANGHREIIDVAARKLTAFVAPGVASLACAFPDLTLPAMHEQVVRSASSAANIFRGEGFAIGQSTLARGFSLV